MTKILNGMQALYEVPQSILFWGSGLQLLRSLFIIANFIIIIL